MGCSATIMASGSCQHVEEEGNVASDSGLYCPRCEYNLTGLTESRCPECGTTINWDAVRRARDAEARRTGTCWERWPWQLKPVGFLATAFQAALLPWVFARQVPSRPRLLSAFAFLAVCMVAGSLVAAHFSTGQRDICMWVVGVGSHVLLQTFVFGLALPLPRLKRPFRFWLAVTCYTSYPLLLEGLDAPPYILPFHKESNLWPFARFYGNGTALLTSIVYYVWWVGLAVIAFVRLPQRHRRRVVVVVLAVLAMTVVSSYSGCQLGSFVAEQLN